MVNKYVHKYTKIENGKEKFIFSAVSFEPVVRIISQIFSSIIDLILPKIKGRLWNCTIKSFKNPIRLPLHSALICRSCLLCNTRGLPSRDSNFSDLSLPLCARENLRKNLLDGDSSYQISPLTAKPYKEEEYYRMRVLLDR